MKRVVVKIGGHAVDAASSGEARLEDFAGDVADLQSAGTVVAVVHGGGPQITALLARVGVSGAFHEGLRITDDDTMSLVAMALSLVNLQIVSAFHRIGARAVGLTGADGGLLTSVSLGEPWGRVGAAPRVQTALLEELWSLGVTPILCPVALDAHGGLLNVNADAAAGAVAGALDADALVLLSDVDQVRRHPDDPTSGVDRLTRDEALDLVATDRAREGMRPKLLAALDALGGGAGSVTLASGARPHALRAVLDGSAATTEVIP